MKYIILYNYDHYDMGGYGWHFCDDVNDITTFINALQDDVKSSQKINECVKIFQISRELTIKPLDVITKFELE